MPDSVTRCCLNHTPNFIVHTQYTVGKRGYTYTVHSRHQSVAPQRVPSLSRWTFTGGPPDRHSHQIHNLSPFCNRPEMLSQNCSGSYLRKCESKPCCKTVHLVRLRFLVTCCLPASAYRPSGNSPGNSSRRRRSGQVCIGRAALSRHTLPQRPIPETL